MSFQNIQAKVCPYAPAGIQLKLSDQTSVQIPNLGSIRNFPTKCLRHHQARVNSKISQQSPMSRPELIPIHSPSKIPSHAPSYTLLPFHTKRTSFHTPNLPPILLSHPGSLQSPHTDSVPHMGYTRPPLRPHGSHCTRIPGWIPLPGPVPDASPGYSRESSHVQGLISDYYPPKLTHPCLRISATSTQYRLDRRPLG